MIKILAICGSIRKASVHAELLRAAKSTAKQGFDIILYDRLEQLPLFTPDLEGNEPQEVLHFRSELKSATAILIASPEYAHGITGVLKNALDWVVGSGEFVGKPVALLQGFTRAVYAQESLKEILKTMDAKIIHPASIIIGLPNNKIRSEEILSNDALKARLEEALDHLNNAILTHF